MNLQQELYIPMPVSQKPEKEDAYMTFGGFGFGKTPFKNGKWEDWSEKNTHWLQPMKLGDVLGSLKVPVWKPANQKPTKLLESYYCKVRSGKIGTEFKKMVLITLDGQWQTDYEVIEWLDEGNLSDLLSKVADDKSIDWDSVISDVLSDNTWHNEGLAEKLREKYQLG